MNGYFVVILILMSVCALVFLLSPMQLAPASNSRGSAKIVALSVLAAVSAAALLYFTIGRPDVTHSENKTDWSTAAKLVAKDLKPADSKVSSVSELTEGLVAKLQENPDDGDGWVLLAKSYKHLGRMDEARSAYERAKAVGRTDAFLEKNLYLSDPIAEVAAEVRGRISIDPALIDSIEPDDVLFITAKTEDGSGMPLAVLKRDASDLPFDFVIDDQSSMVAGRGVSTVEKVIVIAKISPTGDALQTKPGFEVFSNPIPTRGGSSVMLNFAAKTSFDKTNN